MDMDSSSPLHLIKRSDATNPSCQLPALLGPPKQISCYSSAADGSVTQDGRSLRYFMYPSLGTDMSQGFPQFLLRHLGGHVKTPLDSLLRACLDRPDEISSADVVTWRGILYKMMLGFSVDLNVSYIDGTLYIEDHQEKSRKHTPESYPGYVTMLVHPFSLSLIYRPHHIISYVFEHICTTPPETRSEGDNSVLNISADELWVSIITRTLGDLNLLFGGEVDCIKGSYTGQPDCFLELKLTKEYDGNTGKLRNRRKWFMQSHLIGINEIFVGYRDANNILQRTEMLPVSECFPKGRDPQQDIDWGYRMLSALKQYCQKQTEGVRASARNSRVREGRIWRVLNRGTESGVSIRELTSVEVAAVNRRHVGQRIGILPAWYLDQKRNSTT
ncbi:hypothetical protein SERLA73DRAFT_176626 [Serpula lacrymans var. lacrymans S7.3]|uniref:Decapping nuclease n=2 Tax=Serpula lacrymans var. lacrymans TaxID=341189 RepID=F8PNC3_SERL3|nr:uncharacterized protein SERLADRAFT_459717 [Serpula lacrymans var. lacrymans S7.9]EGO03105.1 hypothetical protein SERLA73DRAFT_176626 [Serpula lacrymans var. lacrymans S7.3]EGO28866.1 hypothetical protein SERLADRAFT_459717 [Serpula lacrymans var. lacrymans S7.9]